MSYNEWLVDNTNGTPRHYLEACGQNGWVIDFRNADLCNADLSDADMRYVVLHDADLRGADLRDADLRYAALRNADLRYAALRNANLRGVTMSWNSHALIGERLRQAANEDYDHLALAEAVAQNPRHCWDWFLENTPRDVRSWALREMRTWIKKDDMLPKELTSALNEQS